VAKRRREPETATIVSVSHDGRGIADAAGKKVFVAGALRGEEIRFLRRKRHRNYDEAELLEVIRPSPARIEPRCAVFGSCGGCSLQHMTDADQRGIKRQTLVDNLQRIGKVEPDEWLPDLYNEEEDGSWHYRRRARLAVKDVPAKGRVLVGFRERHAPYVTSMTRCEVLATPVDSLIEPLSELVAETTVRARLPQIEVAVADNQTVLVFRVLDQPTGADIDLIEAFASRHGIVILLQPGGLDSIRALRDGEQIPELVYRLDQFDVECAFDATDFVQINASINQRMVSRAVQLLDLQPSHRVLDLFCGIGNFSLPLARRCGRVLGLEVERRQVERAAANARRNGIGNCEFRVADLAALDGTESWLNENWDRMLLDPARSGADGVVARVGRIMPGRIVYVSCHPGTLARDAGELVRTHGYRLESAGIIDMFPHTAHVESIAVFNK